MNPTSLKFTPSECLAIVQEDRPRDWPIELVPHTITILQEENRLRTNLKEAAVASIKTAKNIAEAIMLNAAYYQLMVKNRKVYREVKARKQEVMDQLISLEDSSFAPADKYTLTQYYQTKIEAYDRQLETLLRHREPCEAIEVVFETVSAAEVLQQ